MPQPDAPLYKRYGPWIVAITIFLYLFWRIDIYQFFDALLHANPYIYIFWLTVFIIIWYLIDSQNLVATLNSFNHEITFREMLSIRGVTYLLFIINYTLSAGGIVYYLKRDKGIPMVRGASLLLFYTIMTQIALFVMAAFGCLMSESSSLIDGLLIYSLCSVTALIIGFIVFKYLPQRGFTRRIKEMAVLKTFEEATLRTYVLLCFWRVVYYSTFIFFYYVALKAFHMNIPLLTLTAYVPIILLIISLPVTPFGMGTSQAAMVVFFKDFGSEANILAFGIVYSTSILIFRGLIGVLYLRKAVGLYAKKDTIARSNLSENV